MVRDGLHTDPPSTDGELGASKERPAESIQFEALLAEISTAFINLPADRIHAEIQNVQRLVCELLDIDRSSLWQVPEGHGPK